MYSPCAHRYEGLLLQVLLRGGCSGRGMRGRRVGPSSGRRLGPGRARALLQVVRPAVGVRHRSRVAERVAGGRVLQLQQILNYKAVYFPRFKDFCVSSENTSFATHSTFGFFFSPPLFSCTTSLYHERVGRWDCTSRFLPGYRTSSPEDGIGNRRNHWEKREREREDLFLSLPSPSFPPSGPSQLHYGTLPRVLVCPLYYYTPRRRRKSRLHSMSRPQGQEVERGTFSGEGCSYGGSSPAAQARPSELSDSSLFTPTHEKRQDFLERSYPTSKGRKSPFMLKVGRGASFPPIFSGYPLSYTNGEGGGWGGRGLWG